MTFTEVLAGNREDLVDINQEKSDRALAAAKKTLTICLEFSGKNPGVARYRPVNWLGREKNVRNQRVNGRKA